MFLEKTFLPNNFVGVIFHDSGPGCGHHYDYLKYVPTQLFIVKLSRETRKLPLLDLIGLFTFRQCHILSKSNKIVSKNWYNVYF